MRHVENALYLMRLNYPNENIFDFLKIENIEDVPGVPPVVSFTIQSDPIKMVGINGLQAQNVLEYCCCLFESLNAAYPCDENIKTIDHIREAIDWQNKRTKDRISRNVEGENKE